MGQVLLDPTAAGPRLPVGAMHDEALPEAAAGLVAHMQREAGATLLPLWAQGPSMAEAPAGPAFVAAFLLEHEPACPWRACEPGEAMGRVPPGERELLQAALSMPGRTPLGSSPAWLQPSWWTSALQWLEGLLGHQGLALLPGTRVLKSPWGGSAVLAFATSDGDRVFKVSAGEPPEAAVLALLQGRVSEARVPVLVGHEPALGCLVMRPFAGRAPMSVADHARAVRAMAGLQIIQAGRAPQWAMLGGARRDGAWLQGQLGSLLLEIPGALVQHGVADAGLLALGAKLPVARRHCAALDECGWPLMLHHEDFRPDNVVLEDDGVCIFDWADTAFGHPAWALQRYLQDLPADASWHGPVAQAYLEPWSGHLQPDALAQGLRVTRLLAPLYELARYAAAMDVTVWAASNPLPGERAMAQALTARLLAASREW